MTSYHRSQGDSVALASSIYNEGVGIRADVWRSQLQCSKYFKPNCAWEYQSLTKEQSSHFYVELTASIHTNQSVSYLSCCDWLQSTFNAPSPSIWGGRSLKQPTFLLDPSQEAERSGLKEMWSPLSTSEVVWSDGRTMKSPPVTVRNKILWCDKTTILGLINHV